MTQKQAQRIKNEAFKAGLFLLMLCLFTVLGLGCAGLGPRTQVPPSRIGADMSLDQIRKTVGEYTVYFAGLYADPQALVFVPKKSRFDLAFSDDWNQVRLVSDLRSLIRNIEKNETPFTVRLEAVVPPKESPTRDDLIAYIYSKHSASLDKRSGSNAYRLGRVLGGDSHRIGKRDRD